MSKRKAQSDSKERPKKYSKEETRMRLMVQTRYSDDFLKKPKLPYVSSSRRSSTGDAIGVENPSTNVNGGEMLEVEKEYAAESEDQLNPLNTPSEEGDNKTSDLQSVSASESEEKVVEESAASVFERDLMVLQELHDFLKLEKRLGKLEKDLNKIDKIIARDPRYQDLPFLTLRDMLYNRLKQEEMLSSFLQRTESCLQRALKDL